MFDDSRTVILSSFIYHASEGVIPVLLTVRDLKAVCQPSGAMPSNPVQSDGLPVSNWGALVGTGLGRFPRWRYWRIHVTCPDHPLQYQHQNQIHLQPLWFKTTIFPYPSSSYKSTKTFEKKTSLKAYLLDVLWWSWMTVLVGRDVGWGREHLRDSSLQSVSEHQPDNIPPITIHLLCTRGCHRA